MARQVALAAATFDRERTGHGPERVTVVISGETVVITLHGSLSPAERALMGTEDGAAQVAEFHRRLFDSSVAALREEIKRITGVAVREAAVHLEPATGTVVQVFTTGTTVQVFLLDRDVPDSSWNGTESEAAS